MRRTLTATALAALTGIALVGCVPMPPTDPEDQFIFNVFYLIPEAGGTIPDALECDTRDEQLLGWGEAACDLLATGNADASGNPFSALLGDAVYAAAVGVSAEGFDIAERDAERIVEQAIEHLCPELA